MCFCEVDLLTCKSEHNERQATNVFLSTHNFPSKPPQAHNMKKHHRSHMHSCTEIIFALASNSPLLPITFCVHIHIRADTESGSGREMDVDSSAMSDSSANRSFESDLYNVSVEQNRFTKRIELFVHDSDWISLCGSRVTNQLNWEPFLRWLITSQIAEMLQIESTGNLFMIWLSFINP